MTTETTTKKNMLSQAYRLSTIESEGVMLEDFYTTSLSPLEIKLQGEYTSGRVEHYNSLGFNLQVSTSGFIRGNKDGILIVLT